MSTALAPTCYLEAERERLRLMPPELGKVRSRRRRMKAGLRTYFYLDFFPLLRGSERFVHGIMGSSFADEAEAERTLARISLDAGRLGLADAAAQFRQPRARQNLVVTHAERWLAETHTSQAPNSIRCYESTLRCYFGYWAFRSIHEVTTANLRVWLAELRTRGLSEKTIALGVDLLKCTLRRYREDHPSLVVPVWPRLKILREPQAAMPLQDILEVLARIPEPDVGIYLCCFYAFCRPAEARGALVQDYDFRTGQLTICRALKTASGRNPVLGRTKTGKSGVYRLPEDLRAWLAKYRGEARLRPQEPLFPNVRTGQAWEAGIMRNHWRGACARADVPYVSLYRALKHSAGTALIEAGLSREDLQAAFRHRSAQTTMIYELEDTQRRERATRELEKLVGGRLSAPDNTPPTMRTASESGSPSPQSDETLED